MPYSSNKDLPDTVQNVLPAHGQDIYRSAFNSALNTYQNPKKRKDNSSLEKTAHRVAWHAVEQKYHKNQNGHWVKSKQT